VRRGLVVPEPKKRPKACYVRFEADQPNECWQADFTHYRLTRPDGRPGGDAQILSWIDDHSRYPLSVTATPGSPARSCSLPSAKPQVSTGFRLRR
jgi:hypothetical protein